MVKMKQFMTKAYLLIIGLISLFVVQTGIARSSSDGALKEDPKGFVICERIKRQGICEEYRLNMLSATDRQLITKHCTVGARCPEEGRIGYCVRYKDPDDLVFDKHYYYGTEKKHDWDATTIEETCINSGGKYHEG
jgi:hypothetical protein